MAVFGLALWRPDQALMLITRRRPRPEPKGRTPDEIMWEAGKVFAEGLSVPVVIIDYNLAVHVHNPPAEELTGRSFYAVHKHSFGLLLTDEDEDALKGWIGRYLKDYREGEAVQLVGHRRPLTICRPDGTRRQAIAILTHFGNGHGGIQIELSPDLRKAA
ncbi:hypothetical protein [Paramagnetospirillum magneticum]|uniref:hypothetical protein n=1 Tax=Paramagnetospirillum magneticum TaxID=84159 RepID=UPI0002E2F597|nr:hypothetical protein [Paramagnetospirillum magneticum]